MALPDFGKCRFQCLSHHIRRIIHNCCTPLSKHKYTRKQNTQVVIEKLPFFFWRWYRSYDTGDVLLSLHRYEHTIFLCIAHSVHTIQHPYNRFDRDVSFRSNLNKNRRNNSVRWVPDIDATSSAASPIDSMERTCTTLTGCGGGSLA